MVLLRDVVQVPDRSAAAPTPQLAGFFQFRDHLGIGWVPVHIDHSRRGRPGDRKAFCKNRFAASASRLADSRKSIVAPVESTARYKYVHLPATRRYISSTTNRWSCAIPGDSGASIPSRSAAPSAGWRRGRPGDFAGPSSPPDSGRSAQPQVPTDAPEDNPGFEMSPLEHYRPVASHRRLSDRLLPPFQNLQKAGDV